jgi:hypothetical protein
MELEFREEYSHRWFQHSHRHARGLWMLFRV